MVRTMSVVAVIRFLLQISISKAWDSRLFPSVPGSFRTSSSSPCNGPFFISVKPYLMLTPNVNNVPVIQSPDYIRTARSEINEMIAQEIVGIEEEDVLIMEGSTRVMEPVLADNNEIETDNKSFVNDPVVSKENIEYTHNIENNENMSAIEGTPEQVD